jgi:hypothetical protein
VGELTGGCGCEAAAEHAQVRGEGHGGRVEEVR